MGGETHYVGDACPGGHWADETRGNLRARIRALEEALRSLAAECHATILQWAPQAQDWDAARLCRRHLGLPEPYEDYCALLDARDG